MKNNIGLFVTGTGIGIFLGLSDSPILLQVLVPFLTLLSGLLSIFSGQRNHENPETKESELAKFKNLSSIPMMLVVVGMVVGSFLGMFARNYDVCSPSWLSNQDKESEIKIVVVPIGGRDSLLLDKQQIAEITNQIRGNHLSSTNKNETPQKKEVKGNSNKTEDGSHKTNSSQTVLHESQEELCNKPNICIYRGAELVSACRYVEHDEIKRIVRSKIINTDSLKLKINEICKCKQ